jgi:hypothetical protein
MFMRGVQSSDSGDQIVMTMRSAKSRLEHGAADFPVVEIVSVKALQM